MLPPHPVCPYWWSYRCVWQPVWGIWHCCACIWGYTSNSSGWEDPSPRPPPSSPVRGILLRFLMWLQLCLPVHEKLSVSLCGCHGLSVFPGGWQQDYRSQSRATVWVLQRWPWVAWWTCDNLSWPSPRSQWNPPCLGRGTRRIGLWCCCVPIWRGHLSCFATIGATPGGQRQKTPWYGSEFCRPLPTCSITDNQPQTRLC